MLRQPTVLTLSDAAATLALGQQLGNCLTAGTVLLLRGDLGSGKTTLVKGLGLGLGIAEAVDSPTFTLINEYLDGRLPLYHIDLYRIEPPEVEGLLLDIYWEGQEVDLGITAIEWAERLPWLPPESLTIELSHREAGRQAVVTPTTEAQGRVLEGLAFNHRGTEAQRG